MILCSHSDMALLQIQTIIKVFVRWLVSYVLVEFIMRFNKSVFKLYVNNDDHISEGIFCKKKLKKT